MHKDHSCNDEPYGEHAQAPGSKSIKNIDMLKVEVVSMLTDAKVPFPIKSKSDFLKILPAGSGCGCSYKGKTMTLNDLVKNLGDKDFPIKNAGDAATLLATRCPI